VPERSLNVLSPSRLISLAEALACLGAVTALCWQTVANPDTRMQIWVLVGMIGLAVGIEVIYRSYSGRAIHMGRE